MKKNIVNRGDTTVILTPWKMIGEYADGEVYYSFGNSEEDCLEKLLSNEIIHGYLVWYSGANDEYYIDGEKRLNLD